MCSWWLTHLWVWRLSGALCASGDSHIVGLLLAWGAMCKWRLAHCGPGAGLGCYVWAVAGMLMGWR